MCPMVDYNAIVTANEGPAPQALRDVLLVPTSDVADEDEEWELHPPAGNPPLDLGRGLWLTQELNGSAAEAIMDACEPRGQNFEPYRQYGCRYAFVRDLPPEEYSTAPYSWDREQVLLTAFTLSRLVLDNGYSTQYAARVVEFFDDHTQIILGPVNLEGALAYRARDDRDWLDAAEARQLATLLDRFWSREKNLTERVGNAIWLVEQAARRRHAFEALLSVVAGLEALTNTGPRQSTKQFVERVSALAQEVGVQGVSRSLTRRLYERRSVAVHGRRLRLIAATRTNGPTAGDSHLADRAIRELALIQDVLRGAVRRCIEDETFGGHFVDENAVRTKWPVLDGDGAPL